jgi:enoyl-[acyl-carrier-protein] reductase (NADH)
MRRCRGTGDERVHRAGPGDSRGRSKRMLLQAAPTPEDIAGSALFQGSKASWPVTGENLLADAGLSMTGG